MRTCLLIISYIADLFLKGLNHYIIEPVHEISVRITSASREGSGEVAHMPILAYAFTTCIHKVRVCVNARTIV